MSEKKKSHNPVYMGIMIGAITLSIIFHNISAPVSGQLSTLVAIIAGGILAYKNRSMKIGSSNIVTVIVLVLAGLILIGMFLPAIGGHGCREKARRISCASNLKQIGLAMKQYAMDYKDWFPDKDGAAGFEQLRSTEYLSDYKVYVCPSTTYTAGSGDQPLTEDMVSYEYKGGLREGNGDEDKPLVWEKPTNHQKFGNILYLDGHVSGISGADWFEKGKSLAE